MHKSDGLLPIRGNGAGIPGQAIERRRIGPVIYACRALPTGPLSIPRR
jgi:hypothetical protein